MNLISVYAEAVRWFSELTGWTDAMLHLNAGLAIMVVAAVALARAPGDGWPLLAVIAAALGNEAMDYLHYGVFMADTVSDIGQTIFWPAIILIMTRIIRHLTPSPAATEGNQLTN
jgi:lipoprotein signal peptidase